MLPIDSQMAFWSGEKILENRDVIVEPPFNEDQIDCNAYTLRMGGSFYCTADEEGVKEQKKTLLSEGACFLIPPGQFAFLLTKEIICVPDDAMAFISIRTGIKLQGLINVSGFHVDPGYRGRLIYAVFNASPSPIQICENERIFKIWFCALDRRSDARFLFDGDGYNDINSDLIKGMNKGILSLQGLADKLRDQTQTFAEQKQTIDTLHIVWRTIIIAAIITVIGLMGTLFLTFTWPLIKNLEQHVFESQRPAPALTPSSEKPDQNIPNK